jgi:hypothetical protein
MKPGQQVDVLLDNRIPVPVKSDGRVLRFRFSPRDAKVWSYVVHSEFPGLDGRTGAFTAVPPPTERSSRPSAVHPAWWIDDQDPSAADGIHAGAKSVSRWREDFLGGFAERTSRCQPAATGDPPK